MSNGSEQSNKESCLELTKKPCMRQVVSLRTIHLLRTNPKLMQMSHSDIPPKIRSQIKCWLQFLSREWSEPTIAARRMMLLPISDSNPPIWATVVMACICLESNVMVMMFFSLTAVVFRRFLICCHAKAVVSLLPVEGKSSFSFQLQAFSSMTFCFCWRQLNLRTH